MKVKPSMVKEALPERQNVGLNHCQYHVAVYLRSMRLQPYLRYGTLKEVILEPPTVRLLLGAEVPTEELQRQRHSGERPAAAGAA